MLSEHMSADVLADGGDMGALMRSIDWAKTPLGPCVRLEPGRCARPSVSCCAIGSRCSGGGARSSCRSTTTRTSLHPGREAPERDGPDGRRMLDGDLDTVIGPMIEAPFRGEAATSSDNLELLLARKGFLEETHFKFAYSPVPDETVQPTGIGGVLATVAETTEIVYGERQLRTLRALGAGAADAQTPEQACATAAPPSVQSGSTHSVLAHGLRDRAYRNARSGPPINASRMRQPAQCE